MCILARLLKALTKPIISRGAVVKLDYSSLDNDA